MAWRISCLFVNYNFWNQKTKRTYCLRLNCLDTKVNSLWYSFLFIFPNFSSAVDCFTVLMLLCGVAAAVCCIPVLVYTLCIFIDDKFADLRRGFVLTAYLCSGCICCFRCVNDSQTVSSMLSCHSILIQQALDCVYQQD